MPVAIVARILGLFLLVTAGLKFYGLALDPAGRTGLFSGPEWQVGIFELEIFLALWLLSGAKPVGAWLASLLAFGAFATASFYLGYVGQASCGCFGAVKVNPWYTFTLDIVILALLLWRRPDLSEFRAQPRHQIAAALVPLSYGIVGVAFILLLLSCIAYMTFGSTRAALAHLRGERISISPRVLDMGLVQKSSAIEGKIQVINWTGEPMRIIGGTSDCSCVATEDLPINNAWKLTD